MKYLSLILLLLPILLVTYPSYAYTDAELTAKYHGDMSAIESDLASGVLKCSDLPNNIKSGSCTDDTHKVVLPDGSSATALNFSWLYWLLPLLVVIAVLLGTVKLIFNKNSSDEKQYREKDTFPTKGTSEKLNKKTSDRLKGKTHD